MLFRSNIPGRDGRLEIVWVDDTVDAFFLHIQGSGRIVFEDGSLIRLGYAAQNGRPYVAIGRELVSRPPQAFRCSPTLTIFMVLVPPALPKGSPMVSTI